MNKPLSDIPAERAILAGICQYGVESFLDVVDIIETESFTSTINQICFECISYCFKKEPIFKIDVASIHSAANQLGLTQLISDKTYSDHVYSLFNFSVDKDNIRKFAIKVRKFALARKLREELGEAQKKLLEIDGSESISEILSIGESVVVNFMTSVGDENEPKLIGEDVEYYVEDLIANPVDQIGFSTGFPRYDAAIGGGLRPATVNVIGARPKCGKSTMSANMGFYIADKLRIPVLNMDTEMTFLDHVNKTLAMMTECFVNDVETGKFVKKPGQEKKIREAAKKLSEDKIPYYHESISGKSFEEQLSIMKRWIVKTVGTKSDGTANPCVIIYDYLKLMTGDRINNNLSEYQLLGFMLTGLQGLAHKYKLPIICFIQLNRDGIDSEESNVAAGSDRITWFCSNFTIFKNKSDEEKAMDGPQNGNRKLVTVMCRHGAGLEYGNYINCHMRGEIARIIEGPTKFELLNNRSEPDQTESTDS